MMKLLPARAFSSASPAVVANRYSQFTNLDGTHASKEESLSKSTGEWNESMDASLSRNPLLPPRAGPRLNAERFRVLIVDDIETNRALLRRRLNRLGVTDILEAEDGAQALDIIRATALDLVLLDIMMPVMTGFDVLEVLAAEGYNGRLPVIVISAMNEMEPTVRAIELGAEDFLLKPFDPTLLRARVLATLEKKQLRDEMRDELARKQAELREARQLQLALAPPPHAQAGLSIDVVMQPALEIGGDLADHQLLPDGRHLLALGDVSGKGAGAALVMARSHALVRSLVGRRDAAALLADPGLAAAAMNAELASNNPSCMFVTMLLGIYDPADGRFDYVRCGHVPPFLRRASGAIERLNGARGLPLGVDPGARHRAATAWLQPGDCLLIVSDGITEAATPDGALFDDARVAAWLGAKQDKLAGLVTLVREFEAGFPASDDLSALLLCC
jgi:sigma-B regulation protein RsbU (phosphoserine phosphatase)